MMELSVNGIPIIDVGKSAQGSVTEQVKDACEGSGCFYVKNHCVDTSLIDSLFHDMKEFFAQPLEYKNQFIVDHKFDRGYFPFEAQNVNAFMGRLNLPNDPVEKLAFGPSYECSPPAPPNLWPDRPPTLRSNVIEFFLQMRDLADDLARIFARAVQAPDEDYFYRDCHDANHSMKANWYPGNRGPKSMQTTRFAEHYDITAFTILTSDECAKALQVKNTNDQWVYADPVPGALFVNLGNVLQRWTNDKWKATIHKVTWPEGDAEIPDRLSVVYFVKLKDDTLIECIPPCCQEGEVPKYEPILYRDYIKGAMERLANVY